MAATYSIGTLAGLSGLSAHTIRAWERRYGALAPVRSQTNRRIYTDEDLERLVLLRKAIEGGHSIGHVANLSNELLREFGTGPPPRSETPRGRPDGENRHLAACLDAIERLAPERLEDALVRANAELGVRGLLDGVAIPLLATIEERWVEGSLRISQEHMASAVLRAYLQGVRATMPGTPSSPRLLVTTPRNQQHEFGALMVAIVAALESWSVTYLGSDLPMDEIADAVQMSSARAVALSLVYPVDDVHLGNELVRLRTDVGSEFPILVGGRAAPHYAEVIERIQAVWCADLDCFRDALHAIAAHEPFGRG